MTDLTRDPPWLATSLAVLAGTVAAAAAGLVDTLALLPAAAGVILVLVGCLRATRRVVTWGGGLLLLGTLVAGVRGASVESLLVALLASVLAYDVAEHGIGIGEQLGREAETGRLVGVHAAATLAVGVVGAGFGYGVYTAAGGGQPVTALVLLLLSGVALVAALRR